MFPLKEDFIAYLVLSCHLFFFWLKGNKVLLKFTLKFILTTRKILIGADKLVRGIVPKLIA